MLLCEPPALRAIPTTDLHPQPIGVALPPSAVISSNAAHPPAPAHSIILPSVAANSGWAAPNAAQTSWLAKPEPSRRFASEISDREAGSAITRVAFLRRSSGDMTSPSGPASASNAGRFSSLAFQARQSILAAFASLKVEATMCGTPKRSREAGSWDMAGLPFHPGPVAGRAKGRTPGRRPRWGMPLAGSRPTRGLMLL